MEPKFRWSAAAAAAMARGDISNMLAAGRPGGIEAQEAQGQRDLCAAAKTLPRRMMDGLDQSRLAKELGIKFGANCDEFGNESEHDIFVQAQFPEGWQIKPSDHSMWSYLCDGKGRRRAAIFYKAAFYDRSSHVEFQPRYYVETEYEDAADYKNRVQRLRVVDRDGENVLFATEWFDGWKRDEHGTSLSESHRKEASAWLKSAYPLHEDVFAYWG